MYTKYIKNDGFFYDLFLLFVFYYIWKLIYTFVVICPVPKMACVEQCQE